MFTNDLRFEGFTTQDWTRLAKAFRPRPGVEPSSESGGGVIVVTADGRPVKLLSTRTGRIQLTGARSERSVSALEWPVSLESLAGAFDASWAVELEWSALNDLMDAWADKLVPDHDAFDHEAQQRAPQKHRPQPRHPCQSHRRQRDGRGRRIGRPGAQPSLDRQIGRRRRPEEILRPPDRDQPKGQGGDDVAYRFDARAPHLAPAPTL